MPEEESYKKELDHFKNNLKNDLGKLKEMGNQVNSFDIKDKVDITPITHDVPLSAIYDRKRDGSYVAKFPNYTGAFDNEDRLSQQQSWYEKVGKGAARFGTKAGLYALDAVVGTAVGVYNSVEEGSYSGLWDNDFSNWIDDLNEDVDRAMPIWHSNDYKDKNILERVFTDPSTFIGSDLSDGLAFVGGALLPEVGLGILSGGATMPSSFAKLGARMGLKGAKGAAKKGAKETAIKSARVFNNAKLGEKIGEVGRTAGFLIRTSNFEASVEARHNFYEATDSYIENYKEQFGKLPDYEEMKDFANMARKTSNKVHVTNLGILSISNTAMFGARFGILKPQRAAVESFGNRLLGLKPTKKALGTFKEIKPTKGQKMLGNTYSVLSKPMVEGLWEEGMQGVAGETMQNYLKATYDESMGETYDFMASLSDAFAHTYGTKEGWHEIGLGMIIGSLGGVLQGGPAAGFGKDSYGRKVKNLNEQIEVSNKAFERSAKQIQDRMKYATSAKAFKNALESEEKFSTKADFQNNLISLQYLKAQMPLKTEAEIVSEFKTIIESTNLPKEIQDELGDQVDAYKEEMIEDFTKVAKDYTQAKKVVRALGLDAKTLKDTEGNKILLDDYLTTTFVMGMSAERSSKDVGEQIESLIGEEGLYNAMRFYSELEGDNRKALQELRTKKSELEEQRRKLEKYTLELDAISTEGKSEQAIEKRRNQIAEQRNLTAQRVIELENEIETNSNVLNSKMNVTDSRLKTDPFEFTSQEDALSNIEKLDQLEKYTETLRQTGRVSEAETLGYLVGQFKDFMDAKIEMDRFLLKMGDTNFLTSDKFQGVLGSIFGTRYKMSEDFKKTLRDNEEVIDRQLQKTGIRGYESVETLLKDFVEENNNLSDREKFRIETILRMTLNIKGINERLQADMEAQDQVTQEQSPDSLEGDSIQTIRTIKIEEDQENNIEILDRAIEDLTEQVDKMRENLRKNQKDSRDKEEAPQRQEAREHLEEQIEEEKSKIEKEEEDADPEKLEGLEKDLEDSKVGEKEPDPIKVMETDDYKRVEKLNEKKFKEGLTEEEQEELYDLEEQIDRWLFAIGLTQQGYRLSDLIRLRDQLKNTPISEIENIQVPSKIAKLFEGTFKDRDNTPFYDIAQTPTHVTTVAKTIKGKEVLVISGMSYTDLAESAGRDFETLNEEGDYESQRGNTVISFETAEQLSEDSGIVINPPLDEISATNYSIILQKEGDGNLTPLESNFDYAGERVDSDAIYDSEIGQEVELSVMPTDEFNKDLIERYKEAETEEARQEVLEEIKRGLVIRVNMVGKFSAVLKAKRETGENKSEKDKSFEEMRNQIVNNEEFLEALLESEMERTDLPIQGIITVKNIFLGHPNMNFTQSEGGTLSIESRRIQDNDTGKVADIGFIENGKDTTQSGEDVNTTFLRKQVRDKTEGKTPFVVIKKGAQRIAYPVEVVEMDRPDNSELESIFNSDNSTESKVEKLNAILAQRGLDIKEPGQAFTFRNINDENFFSNILGLLDGINYFYNVSEWGNKRTDMKKVLTDQVLIDIDLSNPFIAPKVQLDYSKVEINNKPSNIEPKSKKKTEKGGKKKSKAKEDTKKDCK